jgi:hypothetical protein
MEKLTIKQALYDQKSLWIMAIYFILTFYYLGVFYSINTCIYLEIAKIHQNFSDFMYLLHAVTRIIYSFPMFLMLLSTLGLLWFKPKVFPFWAIWLSILMSAISILSTIFIILPIETELSLHGFTSELNQSLLKSSFYYQIIPALIQSLLAFYLLNIYLKDTKFVGRWIFIIIFTFSYITLGTSQIEGFLNYPLWLTVDAADWTSFRQVIIDISESPVLPIIAILPLLLIIPMFWWRPKAIPKMAVILYGLTLFWIIGITIIYFVPDLQIPLNKENTKSMIEELMTNDFRYRVLFALGYFISPVWMFLKIGNHQINENITQ